MSVFVSKTQQQHNGGNHSAIIARSAGASSNSGEIPLGIAVWDPARGQFAFHPTNQDIVLSTAEQVEIVAILNGLSR